MATRVGAPWPLPPAIAQGSGHTSVAPVAGGQTGLGGQATIAALAVPCSTVAPSGHGNGRQMIMAAFPAFAAGVTQGGQITPVVPVVPLQPVAGSAP